MANSFERSVPERRSDALVSRVVGDETLVLDRRNDTVHCLPGDVARVWRACSAGSTFADVASAAGVDEAVAASSIARLGELDLLEIPPGIDRRRFIRRTALAGGSVAVLPFIQSIVAPAVFAAASGTPGGTVEQDFQFCTGQGQNIVHYFIKLTGFPTTTTSVFVDVIYTAQSVLVTDSFSIVLAGGTNTNSPPPKGVEYTTGTHDVNATTSVTVKVYSDATRTTLLATVTGIFSADCH